MNGVRWVSTFGLPYRHAISGNGASRGLVGWLARLVGHAMITSRTLLSSLETVGCLEYLGYLRSVDILSFLAMGIVDLSGSLFLPDEAARDKV